MALRLLPFRQYAETDVINMFALNGGGNTNVTDAGDGDNGVWVKVSQGGLNDATLYGRDWKLSLPDFPLVIFTVYRDKVINCLILKLTLVSNSINS